MVHLVPTLSPGGKGEEKQDGAYCKAVALSPGITAIEMFIEIART